jgi:uncharacterized protein (TIGR01244 family)
MSAFKPVTADFAVSPQLTIADFGAAAAAGYRTVINNRPDGEQPGQVTTAQAEAAAQAAGLAYYAIPISGMPSPEAVDALSDVMDRQAGPILAYCRSGTRSVTLWALAQAKRGAGAPAALIASASQAGYDLSGLAPVLSRLAGD